MQPPISGSALHAYNAGADWQVWFHGAWYAPAAEAACPTEALLQAAKANQLPHLLRRVDGNFAGVVYGQQQLWFFSDRLGMKPLYLREQPLSWASRVRDFEQLPGERPAPDLEAMQEFLRFGYYPAQRSSLEGVHRLPAASLWQYDLRQARWVSRQRYWSWGQLAPAPQPEAEAARHLAELLKRAVQKRASNKQALLLSGGLDSRAMLAAMPPDSEVHSFSFGKPGATDLELARAAAQQRGSAHQTLLFSSTNWWRGREAAVWQTDGLANCLHLHVAPWLREFAAVQAPLFNGFAGDLVAGGSFIRRPGQRIRVQDAGRRFSFLETPQDSFYDYPSEDPFWLDTHVRRFTAAASVLLEHVVEQQKPFLDADLLEYLYHLPDAQRRYGLLYHRALLLAFPEYYRTIPWQRTGFPIARALQTRLWQQFKLSSVQRRLGWWPGRSYTNYPHWLRQPEAQAMLLHWLGNPDAVYRQYFPADWHAEAARVSWDQLGRYLSVAIWLEYWQHPEKRPPCA